MNDDFAQSLAIDQLQDELAWLHVRERVDRLSWAICETLRMDYRELPPELKVVVDSACAEHLAWAGEDEDAFDQATRVFSAADDLAPFVYAIAGSWYLRNCPSTGRKRIRWLEDLASYEVEAQLT